MIEMELYRIVETDNYGRDYPDEKFAMPYAMSELQAVEICLTINKVLNPHGHGNRHWKVVKDGYQLEPGFEP